MKLVDDLMWWMAKHGSQLSVEPINDVTGKVANFKIQLDTRYNGRLLRAQDYVEVINLNSDGVMESCLTNMISKIETLMGKQDAENCEAN